MQRHSPLVFGIFCFLNGLALSAPPVEAPSSPSPAEHSVCSGESLDKIARHHGCRVADLLAANGLKPDSLIFPGQKIKVPAPNPTPAAQDTPSPEATRPPVSTPDSHSAKDPSTEAKHTIAAGETFAAIARQYGIPLDEILAANPDIKPTSMRPGQSIRLGRPSSSIKPTSLAAGETQLILASKEAPAHAPTQALVSPPAVKIQSIRIDRQMTYLEFASRQGTNTRRLNQLNGLDLLDSALLARGTELLAPAQP